MAGGSGTRFWPRSRQLRPKQLLKFGTQSKTLLETTLDRFQNLVLPKNQWVVTTETLKDPVSLVLSASSARILAEPQGRNTAPCLYWAAQEMNRIDPDAVMIVMPSDHWIGDVGKFQDSVLLAVSHARETESLVTLGIPPTRPETGYGYLKVSVPTSDGVLRVEKFVEKPDFARAEEYVRSSSYLWNGGMFVWRVSVLLKAFDQWMPEMRRAWESSGENYLEAYPKWTATSIDYGIMEKATDVTCVPLDCGWDDMGSWASLEEYGSREGLQTSEGTVLNGSVLAVESSGNIVDVPGKHVALLGVQDLVVVEDGDVLLVMPKQRSQDLRLIVDRLKKEKSPLL